MRSIPLQVINQGNEQESRYQLNSPLLFAALSALDPEKRVDMLDLTPAMPEHLDYFRDYAVRLELPGCGAELLAPRDEEELDNEQIERLIKHLIPSTANSKKPLDIILLWDLPNYLDKRVLSALIQYLLPRTDRHSLIHTYIHTRQTMPTRPAEYRLSQENRVLVDIDSDWTARSPMYYQELLHKVFKPFRVERGMLLANGMQEYILRNKH